MTVRSFCNADLPHLVRLWNSHWAALGRAPMIDMARLEQAILARTFFHPESLLVAESTQIDGWCLSYCDPDRPSRTVIGVHCFDPQSDDAVLTSLIEAVESRSARGNQVCVGAIQDRVFGLSGLSPIGYGIGVPNDDSRSKAILQNLGYQQQQFARRMSVSVPRYRPPVNREAMQLRRSATERVTDFVPENSRSAASLCHFDIESRLLIDRSGAELAKLDLWLSDPEAEVMNPTMAILDIVSAGQLDQFSPAETYLIGTAIQSLTNKGISTVETVVDPDSTTMLAQLETLQFASGDDGACWKKDLGG